LRTLEERPGEAAGRRLVWVAGLLVLCASTIALSDQPLQGGFQQTAVVLDAGGQRLAGGPYVSVTVLGEPFGFTPLRGTDKIMHPGYLSKCKLFPTTAGTAETEAPIVASRLNGNWPNPFNPATSVRFDLAQDSEVTLRIFDIQGRLVRDLVQGERFTAGQHSVAWDGRNASGREVASGVYFLDMVAGDYHARHKMVMAR
jgi:hypothetical protein